MTNITKNTSLKNHINYNNFKHFNTTHPLYIAYNTPLNKTITFTITHNFNHKFISDLHSDNIQFTYIYNPHTQHHTFTVNITNGGQMQMLWLFTNEDYNFKGINLNLK
jgi:hypothetical protein